jgi:hypothetical protein
MRLNHAASSVVGAPQFSLTVDDLQVLPHTAEPAPQGDLAQINNKAAVSGMLWYAMDAPHIPLHEPT